MCSEGGHFKLMTEINLCRKNKDITFFVDIYNSGRPNHKVVTHPANSLAQDRESSPAETSVLTTMLQLRYQHVRNVTIYPFVYTEYRHWTDRQTDGRTDRKVNQYRALHALHADAQ